jgi:hypothetical protein
MALSSIYVKYFQKSKVFLYPLLEIKRGSSVTPKETYISWNKHYASEDMKLICVYDRRKDDEYKQFEKNVLLKHNRLVDYVIIDSEIVFVFDFSDLKEDWAHFINGKYSQFNIDLKHKILNFFEKYSGNYVYMQSYLMPEKYFDNYAELLNVDVEVIKSVGELCNFPNIEKETLILDVVDLDNIGENLITLTKPSENE